MKKQDKEDKDPGFRLTRRGKVATSLAGLVLATTAVVGVGNYIENSQPKVHGTVEYTVQIGDNLWNISEQVQNPNDRPKEEIIYVIKDINGLRDSEIKPGTTLVVPIEIQ